MTISRVQGELLSFHFPEPAARARKPSGSPFLEKHKKPRKWEWLKSSTTTIMHCFGIFLYISQEAVVPQKTLLWLPLIHVISAMDLHTFFYNSLSSKERTSTFQLQREWKINIPYEIKSLKWTDIWLMILTFQFLCAQKRYLLRNS